MLAGAAFDLVLVDESSQATDPQLLVALAKLRGTGGDAEREAAAEGEGGGGAIGPQIVLVGDPLQLPPVLHSPGAAPLAASLIERIARASPALRLGDPAWVTAASRTDIGSVVAPSSPQPSSDFHPAASGAHSVSAVRGVGSAGSRSVGSHHDSSGARVAVPAFLSPLLRPPSGYAQAVLSQQYRMNAALAAWPSWAFYGGRIQTPTTSEPRLRTPATRSHAASASDSSLRSSGLTVTATLPASDSLPVPLPVLPVIHGLPRQVLVPFKGAEHIAATATGTASGIASSIATDTGSGSLGVSSPGLAGSPARFSSAFPWPRGAPIAFVPVSPPAKSKGCGERVDRGGGFSRFNEQEAAVVVAIARALLCSPESETADRITPTHGPVTAANDNVLPVASAGPQVDTGSSHRDSQALVHCPEE